MKAFLENCLSRFPRGYARLLRLKGGTSPEKLAYLALLERGDTIVEAGANFGYFTRVFSRVAGPGGQVHAFEPVPPTHATLKANCKGACLPPNLTITQKGLSNEAGQTEIYLPGNDSGQASLAKHGEGSWESPDRVQTFTIELTTLDEYARLKGLGQVDFFKLDIEGAEPLALQGAEKVITGSQPLIHLEVNAAWLKDFDWSLSALADLMRGYGYDTALAYEESAARLDAYTLLQDGADVSTNVIFAMAGKHQLRLNHLKLPV